MLSSDVITNPARATSPVRHFKGALRGSLTMAGFYLIGSAGIANLSAQSRSDTTMVSEEVTFPVGSRAVPGTLTRPQSGRRPAVLLLAGSGPTDRDWNSSLLQGKNGSARLLAEALSARGFVVLRFDKAFSGKNFALPLAELTLDTYVAEASAALALLRSRPEVDPARIFVAGHSEGTIHATRLAIAEPKGIRGLVLMSGPARSLREVLGVQIEGNLRDVAKLPPEELEKEMRTIRQGMADFAAGKDVDPMSVTTIAPIQRIMMALMSKPVAAIGRALVGYEPTTEVIRVTVPVLILQGGKDVQVDPVLDAEALEKALKVAGRTVERHLSPDADHVLKTQPLSVPEIRANLNVVGSQYNIEGRSLDPDVLRALTDWLTAKAH